MIKEPLSWFAQYPKGVAHEINPEKYESIAALLEEGFAKFNSHVAFENMGKQMTYSEIGISMRWVYCISVSRVHTNYIRYKQHNC